MSEDEEQVLEAVLSLTARLARPAALAGAHDLCGRLALLGGARGLALFTAQPRSGSMTLQGAYALPPDYLRRFPLGTAVPAPRLTGDLRDAAATGEPVAVIGLESDLRTMSLAGVAQQARFDATLAVPLVFDGQTVGALHAFYGLNARAQRQQLLRRLAPMLGAAAARGHGAAPASATAARDQAQRLARHVHASAERYQRVYSAVYYAVDHTALVAARYGAALAAEGLARLMEDVELEARDADLVTTGAEGCTVYMADTLQHGAFSQCERVLARFARRTFRVGELRLQLSASAAISCFPENGAMTAVDAARSAREALTQSVKAETRNIVAIAAPGAAAPG
jgi:GGDEF domain-containing protein